MKSWDPRIEEMPKEDLQRMQYKLMKSLVYRLYSFSPFYHDRMKEQKVHPDDIRELSDVKKLPFMFKRDLRDNYPDKIFTSTQEDLVRYHVSSGTTGKPTVVGYTQNDLNTWTTSLARALTSLGLGRGDVIQVSYGYGLFTGGLGLHYGAERIGATVIPTSVGNTERQIELMQDLGATAIACTPSYLLHMGEVAEKMGVSIKKDTKLRTGVLGAEPWTDRMRTRIEDWLGIEKMGVRIKKIQNSVRGCLEQSHGQIGCVPVLKTGLVSRRMISMVRVNFPDRCFVNVSSKRDFISGQTLPL